ncbi:MAG: hypothetical protein EOO54_08375 [Haliea sp.]|nr:MAG: hypothetical protein EOO54_08375 [Haliea sp.]
MSVQLPTLAIGQKWRLQNGRTVEIISMWPTPSGDPYMFQDSDGWWRRADGSLGLPEPTQGDLVEQVLP